MAYNRIYNDLEEAESALNALRSARGLDEPELDLTGLWYQFIRMRFSMMATLAYTWVVTRADELLRSVVPPGYGDASVPQKRFYANILSRLEDISTRAAVSKIWKSMDGYMGYQFHEHDVVAGIYPMIHLGRNRANRELQLLTSLLPGASRQIMPLAIYRIRRDNLSNEQWMDFRARIEADLLSGISEEEQYEDYLKGCIRFHWVDDVEGIHNLEAARQHFKTINETREGPWLWDRRLFLVVNEFSLSSYTDPSFHSECLNQGFLPGDFRGHVLAVEPDWEPSTSDSIETPYYNGTVRVLGNLVLTDLYALVLRSVRDTKPLRELWPLAMEHARNRWPVPI
ncbi:uncharacterized protein DSM5745_02157 [Aspergillus mulundensis]|uniref:Uncharacterized protein n=1 Tax=Aspergillus mulundensis TaxID=1810919 RepID=A0A3D8SVP3_9EURO|nr:hypothetical protein DSM5745_02157 [Aspergillus mulundensis]RDW90382.1 hypothetical protein DSM5745_02157 [Aspergillus mulundensis]